MIKKYVKKSLSLLLVLIMMLSLLPTQAFAVESSEEDHEHCDVCGQHECVCDDAEVCETCGNEVCTCEAADENNDVVQQGSELLLQVRGLAADYVAKFGLSADMSDMELAYHYFSFDAVMAQAAWEEYEAGFALAQGLSADEGEIFLAEENTQLAQRFYGVLQQIYGVSTLAVDSSSPFDLSESITITVSGATSASYDDEKNELTVKAKGTTSGSGCNKTDVTSKFTFTLSNSSETDAVVSFTVASDKTNSEAGAKTLNVGANSSVTVEINTVVVGSNSETFTFSGFLISAVKSTYDLTVNYDDSLGSVTIDGAAFQGSTVTVSSSGVVLKATANGSTFLGWTDATGKIISTSAEYNTGKLAGDASYTAIFAKDGGEAVFALGATTAKKHSEKFLGTGTEFTYYEVTKTHLFDNLGDAITAAQNGSSKAIVLMNNGTITSGYTIPNGVTLLIPYSDASIMSTTTPLCKGEVDKPAALESIVAYRTLTMAPGASLAVANGGAINVNAEVFGIGGSDLGGGTPLGGYGYIKMQSGSSITVQNGGKLYCYGYIGGSGTITATSGASVYEIFQIENFRGGDQTSQLAAGQKSYGVFPMNSYYVQNILVPLTLEYGATEYAYASLYMSRSLHGTSVKFISSSGAMFNMGEGASVTKKYSYADDRLIITANSGTMAISSISMGISNISINSKDYDLPINGNMTIIINSGSTIEMKQDVALLPGVEVYIREGATCRLGAGCNLFVYDMDQWPVAVGSSYVGSHNKPMHEAYFVPERQYTRTVADLEDVYFEVAGEVTIDGNVYTTGTATTGGAAITGVEGARVIMKAPPEDYNPNHHQMIQAGEPANSAFPTIDLTTAKLQNSNGSYTDPFKLNPDTTTTYTYTGGVWVPKCDPANGNITCVAVEGTTATCVEKAICKYCGAASAIGNHAWGEVSDPVWSDDYTTCTITQSCAHDVNNEHTRVATAETSRSGYAASCEEEGKITYTAEFLEPWISEKKQVKEVVEPALPHGTIEMSAVAATCTAPGNYAYFVCGECGGVFEDAEGTKPTTKDAQIIPQLDHVFTNYVYQNNATCVKNGTEIAECDTCETNATDVRSVEGTKLEHNFITEVTTPATCEGKGVETTYCPNGCGEAETKSIPAIGHKWTVSYDWAEDGSTCLATRVCENDESHKESANATIKSEVAQAPTCTEMGDTKYTATFTFGEEEEEWASTQTKVVTDIPATEHVWTVDYSWSNDGKSCVATRICDNDATHNVTVAGTISSEETKSPTCEVKGETTYTATFTVEGEEQWAETQTKTVADIDAIKHAWTVDYDWADDGSACLATRVCENDESHKGSANATIKSEEAQAPACEEMGKTIYTATFGVDWAETQTETLTDIPALSHKDADHNHACDNGCDAYQGEHVDLNPKDHICDYGCEEAIGTHADIDHDEEHLCDHCGVKARDHQYTNGVCDCGYVKDLSVSLVITASGADDVVVPQETIKYGADYAATLDFSAFGKCFTMQTVSIKVGGSEIATEDYNYNSVSDKLTIDGSAVIGDIEIVVTAIQRHTSGEVENSYTAPTCTEAGKFVTVVHCGDCGVPVSTTTTPIPATGHNNGKGFTAVRTEATFQADAYITYSCGACDDDYVEVLEGTRLTAIALIGEDEYETLDEAIAAAEEGDTIVLQTQVAVEGEAAWDLTGITLETADCGYAYGLVIRGKLTINGGTFVANGMYGIGVTATGNLTINDGEFKVNGDNDYLIGSYGATTINGGTFAGQYNCVNGFDGTVAIKGGTFTTADTDCTGEYDSEDVLGNVSVSGGTYSKDIADYVAEGYCYKNVDETYVVGAHVGGEIQMENVTEATCKKTGSHDEVTYCEHCGEETSRETKVDNVIPHTEVVDAYKAPTCEETGLTEGSHCSACGETVVEQKEIPETGHAYDDGKYLTDADKPTCTESGVKTYTCGNDSNHIYTEDVAATDHDWSVTYQWEDDGSACVATHICANDATHNVSCGATITSEVALAPTCEDKGKTKYTAEFDVDWAESKNKTIEDIDALNHDWDITYTWSEDNSSCQASAICKNNCGYKANGTATVTFETEADATCETDGSRTYTATFRNELFAEQVKIVLLERLGHSYTNYVSNNDATCADDGTKTASCDNGCGTKETITDEGSAKGHSKNPAIISGKVATCAAAGYKECYKCSVCQNYFEESGCVTIIDNLDMWRAEGGAGYLVKKPHTEVIDPAVEATCTVEGVTEGSHCSVCGETIVAQENLGTLEHAWDEGRVTIEPNCTEEGVRTFTCSSCRGTKTVAEPALDHDLEYIEAKQPTYSSAGWEAYERCLREDCGYTTYQQIPMLKSSAISDFTTFMKYFKILEEYANDYVAANPGKDPAMLVIKYIRTGVDRYNSGSWNIMAGYEDAGFAEYVKVREDEYNSAMSSEADMIQVTSLKNIKNFNLPNGDYTDIGHMFGTMDISYTNVNSVNHADVSGWTGDLVDLLSLADQFGVNGTLEEMMNEIQGTYFLKDPSTFPEDPTEGSFSLTDFYGDLDGFYVMQKLTAEDYEPGRLYEILSDYFTEDLTLEDRADFLLKNRLGGVSNRGAIRDAVYSAYTQNQVITMLEGTREFKSENLTDLRKACCYVFADYLCKLAGDYVEENENIYFSQFSSEKSTLAPGITQEINKAHTADNKQIVYYIATADLSNQYVDIYANYNESDPSLGWKMSRVKDQAEAAQKRYGDPESEDYIPNYTVVTAINGAGFDMSTGEPGGLLIMGGVEYHAPNDNGFFGILKDGTAKIGTTAEYYELKEQGQIMEGIACFGATLVKDGKIAVGYTEGYTNDRASRTAVGITKTGKVVFMVLDGRQEPVSCGGSMQEIAQIMLEAGCVHAVNLDGGGSTTYLAKQEGEDSISLVSKPSDGYERSVSTSLIMVSTAPSSTEFDHATISASPAYLTVGAQTQLTAAGVSPMGNAAEIPEGTTWQVADESKGTITDDGVFTAKALGDVNVDLMLDGVSVGTITLHVVNPTQIYFTRDSIDAVYGVAKELPLKALYNGKEVAFLESDVEFSMNNADAGMVEGFVFTASEEYTKKSVTITASLVSDSNVTASINVALFDKDAYYFDFDNASGGTRQFAWIRDVSNTATVDNITYSVVDREEDVVATYSFGIDMTQIPMPERIADLTYMLPGADVEGANAWTFLLQLAERISPMSEVRPVITFDSDVEVDYSELSIVCEYFQLAEGGVEFDEETNALTLRLNWKDQTQAIDPETANPICILSGIKVTPKDDAAWDSKDRLSIANVGEISYTIYMRANALYSFSQKPENQEVFGLYPYEDGSDRGGYFTDIYHKFEESYTLDKGMKNGWLFEGEGYAYYVDDEKLLGVQKVDGFYYNFGENGLNIGQTKYTGIFKDGSELRYARVGVVVTSGWPVDGEDTYHCHSDGTAHKATVTNPITCIRGGRLTYSCTQCGTSEVQADFIMPNGHTWDDDHVCIVCGTHGKNIADARIGFGTIIKPVEPNPIPRYYYQAGGVRPGSYVTFNNVTVLSWSNDANVNPDGTMKDLYISWTNNRGMGKAYIEFTGKGDYYGTYRLEYHIIPNDVKNLKVTATTEDTITLKWDAAAGAGYYRLYFLNADGSRTLIDGDIKGLTYTVGGLEEGKSYSFQVASSAISTDGEERVYNCAKWSNTAIGTAGEALDEGGDTPGGDIGGGGSGGGDIGGGDIGGGGGDLGGGEEEEDGNEEEEDTTEWENPFIDVSETAYYADAIAWAVQNGITSGTTETTFSPDRTCTRANAVTFLWRAAGCPEPTTKEMPFSDVDSNAYYYKAVLWAMEQGITMGTTASTFDPNAECTRGQIVTFLWRAEKSPEVSADNPFADVHSSAYYADSVLWAVKEGITNGTSSTTFNPSNDCTRAQIVTFLWRNAGSKE